MSESVTLRRSEDGLWIIAPPGAPTVLDATAEIDVIVLDVLGGHLTWGCFPRRRLRAVFLAALPPARAGIGRV